MLEMVFGKKATVTGKPSPHFFNAALERFSNPLSHTFFVGDDVSTDIGGANKVGARSILVKTGKFSPAHLAPSFPKANYVVSSLLEILKIHDINKQLSM